MKLTEMREILAARDLQLTKSLGQNFLHDENQIRRIVAAAELQPGDRVLEIGPGLGPLTEPLTREAAEVLAIEMDRRLVEVLRERFAPGQPGADRLTLLHDDALRFLRREPRDWTGWKLVANLPYSVASPILVELALAPRGPDRLVATLQLEVARRLMAAAGDDDYGLLTLLVGLHYEARGSFKIPSSCFFPPPDVESACVCLARRERPLLPAALQPAFLRIVKRAFSERRKMMRKLLRCDWPVDRLDAAIAALAPRVDPTIRAERVSLADFARLTELLAGGTADPTPVPPADILDHE